MSPSFFCLCTVVSLMTDMILHSLMAISYCCEKFACNSFQISKERLCFAVLFEQCKWNQSFWLQCGCGMLYVLVVDMWTMKDTNSVLPWWIINWFSQLIPFQLQASKGCQLLNAKIANHRRRLHFDQPVEERFPLAAFCLVCFPSCCKRSQRVLRRGHWMQRGWRGKCKGASLTGDEGYMKDTYSASLGTGENRWCYDSRASLQRLFSTNVHLGGQLAVTSASACWEGASQWENLGHQ